MPAVQNKLVDRITTYLSNELDTKVEVGRLNINFFDKLVLEDFYVEDQQTDTLLYAESLKVNISAFTFLRKKELYIDDISLKKARINLHRPADSTDFNIAFLSDFFAPQKGQGGSTSTANKTDKKQNGWLLMANSLYVDDVQFNLNDELKGTALKVNLPKGSLDFNEIDPAARLLDVKNLQLDNIIVQLTQSKRGSVKKQNRIKKDSTDKAWIIKLDDAKLKKAQFALNNLLHEPKTKGIDFNRLGLTDIDIAIKDFIHEKGTFAGNISRLDFVEKSGFELEKLTAVAKIDERSIALENLDLRTPNSRIRNELKLTYRSLESFKAFPDEVKINAQLENTLFSPNDLLVFIPKLKETKFFKRNADKEVRINGLIKGKVNRLKGKDITLSIGDGTSLEGNFSARDLTNPEDAFLDVKVERLQTSISEIKRFAEVKLPSNFAKLGKLDFSGRFTGFLEDFVADGKLKTDLGTVNSDLKINLRNGFEQSEYSGNLTVKNFDVKTWADNDLFGKTSFSGKITGKGVTQATVDAELDATVKQFTFKGYDYENVRMDGRLTGKFFDGEVLVAEDNLDMKFDGTVDFRDSLPVFDFTAAIDELNLKALNLSKHNIQLAGDLAFDFIGDNIDNVEGTASVYSFDFQKDDKVYHADTIIITSEFKTQYDRLLKVESDIADAYFRGKFDVLQLPAAAARYIETHYPKYAARGNISSAKLLPKSKTEIDPFGQLIEIPIALRDQNLKFDITVKETNELLELLVKDVKIYEGTQFKGLFNTREDKLAFVGKVPGIGIGNNMFIDAITTRFSADADIANMSIKTQGLVIGKDSAVVIPPIEVQADLQLDTARFDVRSAGYGEMVKDLRFNGVAFPTSDYFQVSLLPSDFYVFNRKWDISGDNYIRFGKKYIQTQNVLINHKDEQIALNSFGESGLKLDFSNMAVNWLNDIIKMGKTRLDGTLNAYLVTEDLFKLEGLRTETTVDSFLINDDYWGNIEINGFSQDLKSPVETEIRLTMENQSDSILVVGKYFSPLSDVGKINPNSFDAKVIAGNYSVGFMQYILKKEISDLRGRFDADLHVWGTFKRPDIAGTLRIFDGRVKVNYLQTSYYVDDLLAKVSNNMIDLTGNKLYDFYRNEADIAGGITHDHLSDFQLAAQISSEQFLLLNTEKKDNPTYYGVGIGKANVSFSGPFNKTDINVVATSGEGTHITIPLTDEQTVKKVSFIEFVPKDTVIIKKSDGKPLIRGASVEMQLTVTPEAEIFLPFDERVGDVIKGKGRGDIQLRITRTGGFSVFGNYEIQQGEYLFTYQNFINKPFRVKPGGTIGWTGDPYDARLNIDAVYEGLRVPVYNFILEYLGNGDAELSKSARISTNVDLNMDLVGSLLKPDINFDIEFPTLDPKVRGYVDSKLRLLRDDKNELNRQVFGLIVLGNFLPSSVVSSAQQPSGQFITNTLSEVLSNQLSLYLTDLLSDVVTDVGFISEIDFDVNYRLYQIEGLEGFDVEDPSVTGRQFQMGLKNYLFNNRLLVNIGGNVDISPTYAIDENTNLGSYIAGDFVLEYLLTGDGRYKIRAYNRSEAGLDFTTQVNETGLGFSYRTEFDNLNEFLASFFGQMKKRKSRKSKDKKAQGVSGN